MNMLNVLQLRERGSLIDFNRMTLAFPPIYQLFSNFFNLKRGGLKKIKFKSTEDGNLTTFGYFIYYLEQEKDEYEIYDFFSLEESLEIHERLYTVSDSENDDGLFPIGSCSFDTMIMVGTKPENQDQIFFERNRKEKIVKVANNIFEFIQSCEFQEMEEIFIAPVNYKQLYQNWREDFWRVRENV
jgi:hypothetical protein